MKKIAIIFLLFAVVYSGIITSRSNNVEKKANNPDWWKRSVIYQIFPRSFKDSNNDGIGDLQGIIQKLDHFVDLGVDAIWLSPIYKSPMVDTGYDVSDYRAIAEEYGTLEDFQELLTKVHELGLKLILDFVPNHTSDLHDWFNKSVNREPGYEDYYMWNDGVIADDGTRSPPNNWISVFSNSAWEWNEERQQYYFHQFTKQQPDLNLRNEKVLQELKDVMIYWLDMGIDGFRVDAVPHMYEDAQLRDEPIAPDSGVGPDNWNYLDHIYTKNQPETYELVYNWREFLDNYTATAGGDTRVFMTECAVEVKYIVHYYGDGTRLGAHFSLNFDLLGLNTNSSAMDIYNTVNNWYTNIGSNYTMNWLTGNHDNPRVGTRVGPRNIDAYSMLITFLDGVTIVYMGEEIGQENGEVTCEEGQDPNAIANCSTYDQVSRDFERTPFQWDTTVNAGFNEGAKPWLPVSSKYLETNLADEINDKNSHYNTYKNLINMKKQFDDLDAMVFPSDDIFLAIRPKNDTTFYAFIYNVNKESFDTNMINSTYQLIAKSIDVDVQPGESIILKPGDSIIVQYRFS